MTTTPERSGAPRGLSRLAISRRTIQIGLGCLWVLDGLLKFQPRLWHDGFVATVISPNATGQPAPLAWLITHMATFLGHGQAFWVTVFGIVEIAIGLGLFFRRTVKPAIVVSVCWAAGIWIFGEGLGGTLTGQVSPLMGAPGASYLYAVLAALVWPVRETDDAPEPGLSSSAVGSGRFGVTGGMAVWAGIWLLMAVIWLFPANRTGNSIHDQLTAMGPGEPGWYAHILTSLGNTFSGAGVTVAVLLAVLSMVIGFGPLFARRPERFIVLGMAVVLVYWVTGEALGQLPSLAGTDPNNGPPLILLGLGLLPFVPAAAEAPSLVAPLFARYRFWATTGVLAIALVPIAVGVIPASTAADSATSASSETGMVMGGMNMSGGSSTSTSTSTASCSAHQNGVPMTGLDLSNTPYMSMGGPGIGMDMNGTDASAAAGFNTTKTNWHYTGAPIPSAIAAQLLSNGGNGPDDIHMAATGCAKPVTASQQINATQYVQSTSQAAARYATPAAAVAAGYVAASPTDYPVVTYVNPTIVAANAAAKRTLDPQYIDGLVYATIPSGQTVLAAAMYLLPSTVAKPPMPYGALVQWHKRTDVCGHLTGSLTAFDVTGVTPCAAGTVIRSTPYVTMVWQVPVAGGPLAIQPPDIQIVEAAVMAAPAS